MQYFQGSLDYLRDIRAVVDIPVMRKDFLVDPYQLFQARAVGADAVLLIAECLAGEELRDMYQQARELDMSVLVELHDENQLDRVLDCGARIVGVNNRDLRTFEVDLQHTVRLRVRVPEDRLMVGESGIRNHDDVQLLEKAGVEAILVGESLTASPDIGRAVDAILGRGDNIQQRDQ